MFTANLVPGQGFQEFKVHKQEASVTKSGRATSSSTITPTDVSFWGQLTKATQREMEQWKQNGHPITHAIIEFSAEKKAEATDYLVSASGRQFYVQGTRNPGDLNVTMIYYVEERYDVKKRTE